MPHRTARPRSVRAKYLPGERRYVDEVRPAERADVLVDNTDPAAPVLVRRHAGVPHLDAEGP